jgi:predicted aspartyl protease
MRKSGFFILALCAVLISGGADAACQFVKVATVKIMADGNRFFIPGSINGQDVLFMVDTGAEFSLLSEGAAGALGLGVSQTGGQMYGVTGNAINVGVARVADMSFGGWSGHNVYLRVAGEDVTLRRGRVVAILGQDFLHNFDVEFDVKNSVVNLFQPKDCEDANLAYWSDSYNVVDMLGHDRGSHHVLVAAKVNDMEMRALLDSGAPFSSLTETTSLALGVGPDSPGVVPVGEVHGIAGAPVDAWMGVYASFTLDQETIKPAKLRFHRVAKIAPGVGSRIDTALLRIQMILGADFIRSHRILISNSQQKVYFTYAGGAAFQTVGPRWTPEAESAARP